MATVYRASRCAQSHTNGRGILSSGTKRKFHIDSISALDFLTENTYEAAYQNQIELDWITDERIF